MVDSSSSFSDPITYPIPDKLTAGLKYTFKVCNLHYTAIFKKYSLCVTHLSKPGTFKTGLQCAISCICMYYIIVLSCCLHSGIRTIKRSKEKNAFMFIFFLTDSVCYYFSPADFIVNENTKNNNNKHINQ
jgi:hypothetical protein